LDESQFKTLRELAKDGTLTQRQLSKRMGVSLGKINYLVNQLLKKGYVKARRFKNSNNKSAYMYYLTPKGMTEKVKQTYHFLQRKTVEYERLKEEIEILRQENHEHHNSTEEKSGIQS